MDMLFVTSILFVRQRTQQSIIIVTLFLSCLFRKEQNKPGYNLDNNVKAKLLFYLFEGVVW